MGHTSREFWCKRENNNIYGRLIFPEGMDDGRPLPLVICSHGFRTNHGDTLPFAEAFADNGFVAYVFDFCGGSKYSQSDGSSLDMSLFSEQHDLESVAWELSREPFVDHDHIYLFGASQGAVISMMAARANSEIIRSLIMLYPAFNLHDVAHQYFPNRDDIPDSFTQLDLPIGRGYIESGWDYDFYEHMPFFDKHVLLIHGDADDIVPLDYSVRAAQAFPNAQLEVIQGGKHGFDETQVWYAMEKVMDFIRGEQGWQ